MRRVIKTADPRHYGKFQERWKQILFQLNGFLPLEHQNNKYRRPPKELCDRLREDFYMLEKWFFSDPDCNKKKFVNYNQLFRALLKKQGVLKDYEGEFPLLLTEALQKRYECKISKLFELAGIPYLGYK